MLFIDKNSSILSFASEKGKSYPLIRQIEECPINIKTCVSIDDTWKHICIKEYDFLLIGFSHTDSTRIIKLVRNTSRMVKTLNRNTKIIVVSEEFDEWKRRVLLSGADLFIVGNAVIRVLENEMGFTVSNPPTSIPLTGELPLNRKIEQTIDLGHFYFDLLERTITCKETKENCQLAPNEAKLFCILYNHSPNLVPYEIIYKNVDSKADNVHRLLHVLLSTLKRKLKMIHVKFAVTTYYGIKMEFDIIE